jgi:putative transposase
VFAALPKSAHPGALAAIREIFNAEDIDRARVAIKAFEIDFGAKYPRAVAKIVDDAVAFLDDSTTDTKIEATWLVWWFTSHPGG